MIDVEGYVKKLHEIQEKEIISVYHLAKLIGMSTNAMAYIMAEKGSRPMMRKTMKKIRDFVNRYEKELTIPEL